MAIYKNHYYVYFVRDNLGHIKIGISNDVRARIWSLQTANPMKLEYFYSILVEGEVAARTLEKKIHSKFSHVRLQGEWFEEKEVIEWVSKDFVEINFCGYPQKFIGRNNWSKELF